MTENAHEIIQLMPKLVVAGADRALDFYADAFGATVTERYTVGGRVVHASVRIGPAAFAVKDADKVDSAPGDGGVPVLLALSVADADAVGERMLAGGARVIFPIADQEYGERGGRLRDPFGHQWMISQPSEQLTPEEIQRRLNES